MTTPEPKLPNEWVDAKYSFSFVCDTKGLKQMLDMAESHGLTVKITWIGRQQIYGVAE